MTNCALVTGGAGLIGSHITDLLVREGWKVRVLDNLEPQTHRRGKPAWISDSVEFIEGDLRDRETITAALDKIDIVFHQAAYGGSMPEIEKNVHVNSFATAQMLGSDPRTETINPKNNCRIIAGCLQRRGRNLSGARVGFPKCAAD
jgi:nucleoside-diphosphate-sugar epimerase